MAQFGLRATVLNRAKGQSAIASAAYQSGEKLLDRSTGETKRYRRNDDVLFTGIFAPTNAPAWAQDRESLWNAYEAHDTRKNASLARKFIIDLPHELTPEQNRYLLQDWIKENFTRKGFAADVAIHRPPPDGDARNIHSHVMVAMLPLDADGFTGRKERLTPSERKAAFTKLRESWQHHANRQLERHGHAARIDHRSLEAQGIERDPERHLGVTATAMQRRGQRPDRTARQYNERKERGATRAQLKRLLQELAALQMTPEQLVQQEQARAAAIDQQRRDEAAAREAAYYAALEQAQLLQEHERGLRR